MLSIGLLLAFSMSVTAKVSNYRLPENLKPSHYRLDLITDLDHFKFHGEVWIRVNCLKSTSKIVLHAVNLNISKDDVLVKEMGTEKESLKVVEQTYDNANSFYIIKVDRNLITGKTYLIYLSYSGQIEESLTGYYRSSYLDRNTNTTKWLAVTQFEPSYARQAFPCFDEPMMKAKFTIRLAHKDIYTAISNMPVVNSAPMKDREGWSWDEFQESVPMSTYLVAWMVSDFTYGEAPLRPNGVRFRIWARSDALDQISLASEVGPEVLEYFEELFDEKYPLPKQDMAAIPDFDAGAMENWGLITYRETQLLYDPARPSISSQQRVGYVIAHELAHQWFGNLVTMKWWTDLWLNEGFATYVGTLGTHNALPELNYLNGASISYIATVYELDSLKSSHPISIKVGPPSEVSQIFDAISYKKGSTIIRMMHNFLGKSFQRGVSNYLKKHKFDNAEQDDLWSALTDQAHEDGVLPAEMTVKEIMDTWTLQTGHPVLKVVRDYERGTASVSQERFLMLKTEQNGNKTCWWFPLTFTSESEADFDSLMPRQWLSCGQEQSQLKNIQLAKNEWLIVNVQLTGLARVLYDDKNWNLIIDTLNSDKFGMINELNRAGLLMDVFDFAQRGDVTYETALRLSSYLSRETAFIPLERGFISLGFLNHMLSRTSNYGIYREYMRKILTPLYPHYNKLSAMPKEVDQRRTHALLSRKFCKFEVGDCGMQARQMYEEWIHAEPEGNTSIPFDLTSLVLCTAVKHGGETVWSEVYNRYLQANNAAEKAILLTSLGCSREVWILNRVLELSITPDSDIRKQDALSVFSTVAGNDQGFYIAFDFFQKNIKAIYQYVLPRKSKLGRYIRALAGKIMFQHELDRLKTIIKDNAEYLEGSKLEVEQSIEKATLNVQWHNDYYDKVSTLLSR